MTKISFGGQTHELTPGQTVLDGLLAAGEEIPHACRAGACGACLLRAESGAVPEPAQVGLSVALKARGCFLACQCRPTEPMIVRPADEGLLVAGRLASVEALSSSVAKVVVELEAPLEGVAGQYVSVRRGPLARSYSIAAMRGSTIELHVRRIDGGALSPFLCDPVSIGAAVDVTGPFGSCFYVPDDLSRVLVLAGTGTGLAPLWGILHDAIEHGHMGQIWLFHGAVEPDGLYLTAELAALARATPNLRFVPCVLRGGRGEIEEGSIDDVVLRHVPKPARARVFLCGAPDMVAKMKKRIYLAGASLWDISGDAFVPSSAG